MPPPRDEFIGSLTTFDQVAERLREGSIWIERVHGGFLYIVDAANREQIASTQALLEQVIQIPGVRIEPWREGWGFDITTTAHIRYII